MPEHQKHDNGVRLRRILPVTVVTAALAATAAVQALPASAASFTATVTSSSPTVIVSGLKKGDVVVIAATLNSTDPNESGEGEPLVLKSTGGYSKTFPEYSIPNADQFTATQDGETLTGEIPGADDDESASVTVNVNPDPRAAASAKAKAAAAKISAITGTWAGGFGIAGVVAAAIPGGQVAAPSLFLVGGILTVGCGVAAYLAADPLDPNYRTVALPAFRPVPSLASARGLTAEEIASTKLLGQNLLDQIALSNAALTSFNRAAGASAAKATTAENTQYTAGVSYLHELGTRIDQEIPLLKRYAQALKAAGVPAIDVTPDQVVSFEQSIGQSGLPPQIVAAMKQVGATDADVTHATQILVTRDAQAVAGTYFAKLADPQLLESLRTQGETLRSVS
jgi:hypothetical protein